MKIEKRIRIGELAQHLKVERFVIRFWEKEFNLYAERSHGGQRFYDQEDINKFQIIKELLYEKGFTIAGAKKYFAKKLKNNFLKPMVAASKTTFQDKAVNIKQEHSLQAKENDNKFTEKIFDLQKKLIKLRELL